MPKRAIVWVVDDSPLEGELVRAGLVAVHDVVLFDRAAPMIERLAAGERPDVLILDWHMPEISGLEACRFVRQTLDEVSLPIAILTASDEREDLERGLDAGANDFLRKPFERGELLARVGALFRMRRLHERLFAAEADLRREASFREQFLAILAHDLRQPLGVFAIAADMLRDPTVPVPTRDRLSARVLGASSRMQRMIEELLDFSRARPAGGLPLATGPVDLAEVVEEVVGEIRFSHPGCAVNVSLTGPCRGEWDSDRLAQIVSNLVENAIAHGSPGSPIDVTLGSEGDRVELAVESAGPTIPPTELPTLFNPFRRGTKPQKRTGLGLGLFIVAEIAKAHGGTVDARSSDGRTRFSVMLPRAAR